MGINLQVFGLWGWFALHRGDWERVEGKECNGIRCSGTSGIPSVSGASTISAARSADG